MSLKGKVVDRHQVMGFKNHLKKIDQAIKQVLLGAMASLKIC